VYTRGELHTEYWESEGKIPLAKYRRRCKDDIKMELQDVKWWAWTGLIWLRIWTGDGLSLMRQ